MAVFVWILITDSVIFSTLPCVKLCICTTGYETGDDSVRMAYSLAIKQGQAQSRDLQVLLVGVENTGKTCLVASFLGEGFVEGQAATEGTDVDVCKIYCRDWKRISDTEKTDHLHHQFVDCYRGSALNTLLSSQKVNPKTSIAIPTKLLANYQSSKVIATHTTLGQCTVEPKLRPRPSHIHTHSPNSAQYDSDSLNAVVWDFAGQIIFHNTHSIFISDDGIPVITFDASVDLTDQVTPREGSSPLPESCTGVSSIHYWLQVVDSVSSVKGREGGLSPLLPTAVLAGTHIDKLHPDIKVARKIAKKKLLPLLEKELSEKSYAQHLAGSGKSLEEALKQFCFFISNKHRDEEIEHLKATVIVAATSLKKMQPVFFLKIERVLLTHKEQIISRSMLLDIIAECAFPMAEDSEEFEGILRYFHGKRTFLHFGWVKSLRNLVILSPRWLSKLFSYVITAHSYKSMGCDLDKAQKRLTKYGILHQSLLQHMLDKFHSDYPSEVGVTYLQVVDILLCFHLVACITKEAWFSEEGCPSLPPEGGESFIVPCLVPHDVNKVPPNTRRDKIVYFVFHNGFIPNSLLNQLIANCICRNVKRNSRLLW